MERGVLSTWFSASEALLQEARCIIEIVDFVQVADIIGEETVGHREILGNVLHSHRDMTSV